MGGLDGVVRGGMFALMLGMGLALSRADFRRIWQFPKAALVGSAVQLLLMPIVGIALALAFGLPALLAAGLVITAAAPGGTLSNMVVHLGRADTALSVTLTATATLVALLTFPLWVNAVLRLEGEAGAAVQVPVVSTAVELATFTIVPLLLGMFVREWRPDARRFEKRLTHGGVALVVGAFAFHAAAGPSENLAGTAQAIPAILALIGAAALLGVGLPLLARVPAAQAATIGVEICLKNTVLGIALAELSLGIQAAVPAAFYSVLHLPVSVAILAGYRVWARRAGAPLPG